MIILVTLMVVASQVLSVRIDDISDSNYVAIDPSEALPVQIDPATITRLFKEQYPASNPGPSPPFNEGFYYTVPARLLLYQPPLGQPYPPGGAKKRGNCDNQANPITMGEYVRSSQRQFKRSNDQTDIPTILLPPNAHGQGIQYGNYYNSFANQRPGYRDLNPTKFSGTGGMWAIPQENVRGWTDRASQVPGGNFPDTQQQYSQNTLASHVEPRQGIIYSQLRGQPSGSGSQFPSYGNMNFQQYGGSYSPSGSSGTGTRVEGVYTDLSHEYQNRRLSVVASQPFQPIVAHHGDVIEGNNKDDVPYSSQIPPSYIVGLKLSTKTQSSANAGLPIWDSPYFPKHLVEPWASKMNTGVLGLQPRPIDSSRAVARDMTSVLGLRPSLHKDAAAIKSKTPWFVLMVPQDSLFRKNDLNEGVNTPWISLSPRTYGTHNPAKPLCQNENLNMVESPVIPSSRATEIKQTSMIDHQYPAAGSLEVPSLLEEESVNGATSGARSLLTTITTERGFLNEPSTTLDSPGETVGIIAPSIETKYIPGRSGTLEVFDYNSKDQVPSVGNVAAMFGEPGPRGKTTTIIKEVITDVSSPHGMAPVSPMLTGQSDDIKQVIELGPTALPETIHGNEAQVASYGLIQGTVEGRLERDMETYTADSLVTENIKSNIPGLHTTLVSGHSPSQVVSHTNEGGTSMSQDGNMVGNISVEQVAEQSNAAVSTTILSDGAPSTTKIIQYITPEGAKQEELGEASAALKTAASSKEEHYIPENSEAQQIIEEYTSPENLNTPVEGKGSTSLVTHFVTKDNAGTNAVGQEDLLTTSGTDYMYINGQQQLLTSIQESSGLNVGSETTYFSGTPTTEKSIPYNTSVDGVRQEITSADHGGEIALETGNLSTKTQPVAQESTVTQNIINEGEVRGEGFTSQMPNHIGSQEVADQFHSLGSTANIIGGASSTNKVIQYITTPGSVRQEIIEDASGMPSGSENHSLVIQYDSSGGAIPKQVTEQASDLGSTTSTIILSGTPTTEEIIHQVTADDSKVRPDVAAVEELKEAKVALGIEGSSTGAEYVSNIGTVTEQIVEVGEGPHPVSTMVDEGAPILQLVDNVTGSSTATSNRTTSNLGGIVSVNKGQSLVTQDNYTGGSGIMGMEEQAGSTATILGEVPATSSIANVKGVVPSSKISAVESVVVPESVGAPSVTEYINPRSIVDHVIEGSDSHAEIVQMGKAPSSTQTVEYITNQVTDLNTKDVVHENGGGQQAVEHPSPVESTSAIGTSPKGVPITQKIIRITTTPDGEQREEIVDESALEVPTDVHPSGLVPQSTTTLVAPLTPTTTTKVVRYITTADGEQREEIIDAPSLALETVGIPSGGVPLPTTTLKSGAPTTKKIIRYITTADGQRQEIIEEPSLALGNGGITTGVVPNSVTTLATTKTPVAHQQIIRIITTPDGERREEIVDEPSLALETVGVPSGNIPLPTATLKTGAPAVKKIIRYITTADGQRQEIVDEPSLAIENGGLVSGAVTPSATTLMNGGTAAKKFIRYITTSDGQRQEIIEEPSLTLENGAIASGIVPQPVTTIATAKTPVTHQKIIRIITTPDGERREEIVDQSTLENGGLSSIGGHYITNGTGGTQHMVGAANTQWIETIPSAGASTSKLLRYVTKGGGLHQEIPGSHFINGQGSLQSSNTIIGGSPSAISRYVNYPQQSGVSGARYMQGFQPKQTSNVIKPASYVSGALPGSASSKSYVG